MNIGELEGIGERIVWEEVFMFKLCKLVCSLLLLVSIVGCGTVSRNIVLQSSADSPQMIEAIARALQTRNVPARVDEDVAIGFYLDRERGTRMRFIARGESLILVVQVDGETLSAEEQEAEFQRGEAFGREILGEAQVLHAEIQRQRVAEERAEAERRAARRADRAQRGEELAAFMAQNQARNQAFQQQHSADQPSDPSPSPSQSSGLSCCVNGAFYECPNSSAVDQCVGRFTRCINERGMAGMESCLESDPPDPSGCSRDSSRDGEC